MVDKPLVYVEKNSLFTKTAVSDAQVHTYYRIRMHCIFRHEFDLFVLNKTAQIWFEIKQWK